MKNFVLIFLFGAFISTDCLSQNKHTAIFYSDNGEKFWVILNGVRQNENPETNVKVNGLNAPGYRSKIVFQDKGIMDIDKNLTMPEQSSEVTFRIKQNKKGIHVLRYFTAVPLPAQPVESPNQNMVTYTATPVYTENPREEVITTTTTTTTSTSGQPANSGDQINMNVNIGDVSMGINMNVNDGFDAQEETTTSTTVTTTSTTTAQPVQPAQPDHYVMVGYSGPMGCPWPMQPNDYSQAKSTIASKSFEDSKMQIAKQIISSNCLFADQVTEITNLFDFEDNKLEFAKYAYTRTYDQGNYFKVNNAFDFESTIEELNQHIQSIR